MPRLESSQVWTCHVAPPGVEAAEQNADMARTDRRTPAWLFTFGNRPATFVHQPFGESCNRIGERFLDSEIYDPAVVAVGCRHRQGDQGRLRGDVTARGLQRCIGGMGWPIAAHQRCEGGIDTCLQGWHRSKTDGQVVQFGSRFDQLPLDLLVERDIGATESIDGLLGVADDEEFSGNWPYPAPI